jgi:hypothetical protein
MRREKTMKSLEERIDVLEKEVAALKVQVSEQIGVKTISWPKESGLTVDTF